MRLKSLAIFSIFMTTTLLSFASANCQKSMMLIMDRSSKHELLGQFSNAITAKEILRIEQLAKKHSLDNNETKALLQSLSSTPKNKWPKLLDIESFIIYSETLRDNDRLQILSEVGELTNINTQKKFIKKYQSNLEKLDKKRLTQFKKFSKEMSKEEASKKADEWLTKFKPVYYGCHASKITPAHKIAANRLKQFTLGIGVGSGIISYSMVRWNEDKTEWRWYGELVYQISWEMFQAWRRSRIISNPTTSFWGKGLQDWIQSRTLDVFRSGGYQLMFGAHNIEMEKKLRKLAESPEGLAEIKRVSQLLSKPEGVQHIFEFFGNNLEKLKALIHQNNYQRPLDPSEIDWEKLSKDDLADPRIREKVLDALALDFYDQKNKDGVIRTGSIGTDRYTFQAIYGALLMPKDIAFGLLTYQVLCMGQLNPQKAFAQALLLFAVNRYVFDIAYYKARDYGISQ